MQKAGNLLCLKNLTFQSLDQLSVNIETFKNDANKSFDAFANNVSKGNSNYDRLVDNLTSVLQQSLQFNGYLNDNLVYNNDDKPHSTTNEEPQAEFHGEPIKVDNVGKGLLAEVVDDANGTMSGGIRISDKLQSDANNDDEDDDDNQETVEEHAQKEQNKSDLDDLNATGSPSKNDTDEIDAFATMYLYKKHQKITITPVYIKSLTHFFGHIEGCAKNVFVWHKDNLPNDCALDHIPETSETVIARFVDNLYYRAIIISELIPGQLFKVLFIDYGNENIVHINDMVSCVHVFYSIAPDQAVLCRFANFEVFDNYKNDHYNCGKQFLQERIIDKRIAMEVVVHEQDDLVVKIVEPSLKNLPVDMMTMGFIKSY